MTRYDIVTVTLNPALDWTLQIPSFTAGAVNRVASESTRPGGKGINVAATLAPDFRVAATGFLGRDNEAPFTAFFHEHRIADAFLRIPGATRVGIKIVSEGGTTDVNFPGAAVSAADVASLRTRLASIPSPWVVLAGSLPPGVDPALYRDLIAELATAGRRVALDTSGDALRHALDSDKAAPEVVKPNIHELESLIGSPLRTRAEILDAARSLTARGIRLVVVSMGENGALFVTQERALTARPPAIAVHSTVGAGDAMVAGIVAARLRDVPLAELARTATACSLRALGAREGVDALRERVTVE